MFSSHLRLPARAAAVGGAALSLVHLRRQAILLDSADADLDHQRSPGAVSAPRPDFWTTLAHDLPRQFCAFADASPSPHHAVDNAKRLLRQRGFRELREGEAWALEPGGRYFVNRNAESGTSLAAFAVGRRWAPGGAFAVVGTHVDSPCLRLKPVSGRSAAGYLQLGVELYGGGLWHTWLDRDLGLAGRVLVRTGPHEVESRIVDVREPLLRVPSLAAHYHRHNPLSIDLEKDLVPLLGSRDEDKRRAGGPSDADDDKANAITFPPGRKYAQWPVSVEYNTQRAIADKVASALGVHKGQILDMDVCLYDIQPAAIGGVYGEYVFSARIDNLMMTYCGLSAFTRSLEDPKALDDDKSVRVLCLFDHEEIGSTSSLGAKSTFIPHVLKRICAETQAAAAAPDAELQDVRESKVSTSVRSNTLFEQSMSRSFFLSADMIHAVHPAHPGMHELNHVISPNDGLVISSAARNTFMRNTPGTYMLKEIACRSADLLPPNVTPRIALFVNPNGTSCGTTLGPHFASTTGIRTMDVGNCQLSMHSAREMAGVKDIANAVAIIHGFWREFVAVDTATKVE